ncbi:MAG TPA: YncE family protein [Mycobacteriales bacterium]|nr:YncE family protein [Mycobacteriales bacterium]
MSVSLTLNRSAGAWRVGRAGRQRRVVCGAAVLALASSGVAFMGTPAGAAGVPTYSFIVVPHGGGGVGVDPKTDTIYESGAGTVSVIDGATRKVTATIADSGKEPGYVAVDPTRDRIYVANAGSGTVTVINGKTNKVTHTTKVGHDPLGIAVNTKKNVVYVANFGSNTVSVINGKNDHVTHTIKVRHHPNAVAVNVRKGTVYATFEGVPGSRSGATYYFHAGVAVISGRTNKVTRLVKPAEESGSSAYGVAVDPTTDRVYVVFDYAYGAVVVLNGKTDKIRTTISVGSYPNMIALNPAKHLMYVGWSGADQGGIKVSIVKTGTGRILGNYGEEQGQTGMAIDPATNRTYISSNDLYLSGNYTNGLEVIHGT